MGFYYILFRVSTTSNQDNENEEMVKARKSLHGRFEFYVKSTFFSCFEVAYFSGFLPVKFIHPDLLIYFDSTTCFVFTVFLSLSSLLI
mmetsp:Transcript_18890/g.18043  ORF Transcript_18890/g.18043 Transcript_18890/m.18043 type:complete len:88 (-) Transcript_18890:540-803(-)